MKKLEELKNDPIAYLKFLLESKVELDEKRTHLIDLLSEFEDSTAIYISTRAKTIETDREMDWLISNVLLSETKKRNNF